jgi:hypothetical protein
MIAVMAAKLTKINEMMLNAGLLTGLEIVFATNGAIVGSFALIEGILFCILSSFIDANARIAFKEVICIAGLELVGGFPIGVNVMWIIIEPLVVLAGNVIIPVVIDGV